jgi:trans-aconitate 2-methyltransferase
MTWDPHTYLAHAGLRERPAVELLARLALDRVRRAYDMGCGTGNSTSLLLNRWPEARVIGVDNSEAMLNEARQSNVAAEWLKADLSDFVPEESVDLIFSNAAYQWVDNHRTIFPRLAGSLAPNGALAIQMPANFDAPSHVLLKETAANGPWSETVADIRPANPVHSAEAYYDMLSPACGTLDIWYSEYQQVLTGDDPVLGWVKGTALVPYFEVLKGDQRETFIDIYAAKLRDAYPTRPDGMTLFPFKRLFIVGRR